MISHAVRFDRPDDQRRDVGEPSSVPAQPPSYWRWRRAAAGTPLPRHLPMQRQQRTRHRSPDRQLLPPHCRRPPESSTAGPTTSGLKPIDQAALQVLVDTTIKDQLVPGAVVVLQTPQGDFTVASGTTELGVQSPPDADTHFRIASNTKTMTAAVILQLAQEGKLEPERPGVEVRLGSAWRRQHHRRGTAENAHRAVQLHQRPADGDQPG